MTGVRVFATSGGSRSSASVGKRGHFHLDGLPPGRYRIFATAENGRLASDEIEAVVVANALAELREPLRIESPTTLRVMLSPPSDPDEERWSVTLHRVRGAGEEIVAKTASNDAGEWISPPIRTGRYILDVGPKRGGRWFRTSVAMAGQPVSVVVDLESANVTGVVTFGDQGLASKLRFADEGDDEQIFVESEADRFGRFTGVLPKRASSWSVEVVSDSPRVKHTFPNVSPAPHLELQVPRTTLSGVVLDERGDPARNATVNITSADEGLVQVPVTEDGWFAAYGLAPGRYDVQASAFLLSSEVRAIDVTDEVTPDPVQLVLQDVAKVTGHVIAESAPVAGAQVWVDATDVVQQIVIPTPTDARGAFGVFAPPGAREVDLSVAAPGFDFRMLHTRVPSGPITIQVRQEGGTIVVPAAAGDLQPYLQHAGATEAVSLLTSLWSVQEAGGKLVIPAMEPGPYSLCFIRHNEHHALRAGRVDRARHCTEGFLPHQGTLVLPPPPVLANAAEARAHH